MDLNDTLSELIWGLVARRRWWILLPACGVALATIVACHLCLIATLQRPRFWLQQRCAERYVTPTSTTDISQALQGMTQEVSSRTRFLSVIEQLGLYTNEKKHLAPEQIIEKMRKDHRHPAARGQPRAQDINAFRIHIFPTTRSVREVTRGSLHCSSKKT